MFIEVIGVMLLCLLGAFFTVLVAVLLAAAIVCLVRLLANVFEK